MLKEKVVNGNNFNYGRMVDYMMELSKRIIEVLEAHDISLCGEITERTYNNDGYDVELETYSPEGEDVIIPLIYDGTEEDFIRQFKSYAEDFDAEEHAEMWIESRGKNGVPESIRDLIDDAEWQKEMFLEVAKELNSLDDEETETDGCMDREQFYQYILDNFSISGEARRLINNILHFVEENYTEENKQYRVLCDLLDGTIGLSDMEIKKVCL